MAIKFYLSMSNSIMPHALTEFAEQIIFRLEENTPRIAKCLAELSEEEVWQRPNASSNSVGNLILHLCGNITQYIHSSLGRQADIRQRDTEFSARNSHSKQELLGQLELTIAVAVKIIQETPTAEWLRPRQVQGFDLSGIGIAIHVAEHYSYHTGQIAFWTKLLKDKDLKFYGDMDLNVLNE